MGTCQGCGQEFTVPSDLAERFPGWTPPRCPACFRGGSTGSAKRGAKGSAKGGARGSPHEDDLTPEQALERYDEGPDTGVFTDGSAEPNPGPGGWGAVYVVAGEIVAQDHGHEAQTTNNRMELMALLRGVELVPEGVAATLYTDSRLAVDTVTKWAPGWERRGWQRKTGPVQNLDLVRPLVERLRARPELAIAWLPAHQGLRWNEYADRLASAWRREQG